MFADPQTVTVATVAQTLAAIERNSSKSVYRKDDGAYSFTISRILTPRERYLVRIDHQKLVSDPFVAANNISVRAAAYLVMDKPILGYTATEVKDMTLGLTAWATSANLLKVLGGET